MLSDKPDDNPYEDLPLLEADLLVCRLLQSNHIVIRFNIWYSFCQNAVCQDAYLEPRCKSSVSALSAGTTPLCEAPSGQRTSRCRRTRPSPWSSGWWSSSSSQESLVPSQAGWAWSQSHGSLQGSASLHQGLSHCGCQGLDQQVRNSLEWVPDDRELSWLRKGWRSGGGNPPQCASPHPCQAHSGREEWQCQLLLGQRQGSPGDIFGFSCVQVSTSQSNSHLHFVKLLLIDTFQVEEGKDCQERNQGNAWCAQAGPAPAHFLGGDLKQIFT